MDGAVTAAFGYLFNTVAHMQIGNNAQATLYAYLSAQDPGQWLMDKGLSGLFGGGRVDFLFDPRDGGLLNAYELKSGGNDAAAAAQLDDYIQAAAGNITAGDPYYVFRGQPTIQLTVNWFFSEQTYTYFAGSSPGVILYSTSNLDYGYSYGLTKKLPGPLGLPFGMPLWAIPW